MAAHGAQHLRIVVARRKRRDAALVERKRRIGYEQAGVYLLAAAQAGAVGASAVGRVEAEVARLELIHRMTVFRACERKRIQMVGGRDAREPGSAFLRIRPLVLVINHMHDHAALGKLGCHLHGLGDTARRRALKHHTVHHHVDRMLELLVELAGLTVKAHDLAVDAHAREALLLEVGQKLCVFALAAHDHGRQDERALALAQAQDLVGHLVGGTLLDLAAALGAMGHAYAREQKTQIVVDLGGGAHGGSRVFGGGLLVYCHGRRQAVDAIEVGFVHLPQKLARVGREAFHIATLAFGVDGVKGQARLARARKAGDDHQLVARDGEVYIFEVVLTGTLDDDGIACHALPFHGSHFGNRV